MKKFVLLVLCFIGCENADKKQSMVFTEKHETVFNHDGREFKLPIYCQASIEKKYEHYYCDNVYLMNLPNGVRLVVKDKGRYPGSSTKYSLHLASDVLPERHWEEFLIWDEDYNVLVELVLPMWK